MAVPTKLLTYGDLLAMPDLGERYELIDGVLFVPPSPSWFHAGVVAEILVILHHHVRRHVPGGNVFAAPVDVRLTDRRVLQPDIVYISPARRHLLAESPAITGAPDLVVEVLSPFNRRHDLRVKFDIYEREGVREYWIADPDQASLTIFSLRDGRFQEIAPEAGLARSVVLPDLTIDVAGLFASLT